MAPSSRLDSWPGLTTLGDGPVSAAGREGFCLRQQRGKPGQWGLKAQEQRAWAGPGPHWAWAQAAAPTDCLLWERCPYPRHYLHSQPLAEKMTVRFYSVHCCRSACWHLAPAAGPGHRGGAALPRGQVTDTCHSVPSTFPTTSLHLHNQPKGSFYSCSYAFSLLYRRVAYVPRE